MLSIPCRHLLCIIGAKSGSQQKATLVRLIERFVMANVQVVTLVDACVRDYKVDALLQKISPPVFQGYSFLMTLLNNIKFGNQLQLMSSS